MSSAVLVCNLERNEGGADTDEEYKYGRRSGGQVPRKECNGRDTNIHLYFHHKW